MPLPDDIGAREVVKIGVVGTRNAGKSHFLAALLKAGDQDKGMKAWGINEFDLDEASRAVFRQSYRPFFDTNKVFDPTNPANAQDVKSKPFIVRGTLPLGTKVFYFFYDIDGESLLDRGRRARYADYLFEPDGLIFLIDPMMIDSIRRRFPPDSAYADFPIRQADLVSSCIRDLGDRAQTTPIAIALSKSDLIRSADARSEFRPFTFQRPTAAHAPIAARLGEMTQIDREVRRILEVAGEADLLSVGDSIGAGAQVTYHAVAPIGFSPDGAYVPKVRPLRCLDPFTAVLSPMVRHHILANR